MMEPPQDLTACYYYPDIYTVEFESSKFNEILQFFSSDFLQGCSVSDVESTLVDYVTSIIEPVGWKAVWKPTKDFSVLKLEHDFIVEVVNVSLEKLEADAFIRSVILENKKEFNLVDLKNKIDVENAMTIPLIELYTISEDDEEELYTKTATAIENVRFFMTHLTRPWDNEDDDIVYSEKILKPRLQLFFDMKNNVLPKTMIIKIKSILKQGWKIVKELTSLYSDMNVSDSEAEINDDDLLQSMSLRTKLNELQAKMEILENPVIRSFMMKKYIPKKSTKTEGKSSPVVYIISKEFTFEMISNLQLEPSCVLEFEHNAENAFKCSSAGDKIFLFPGVYQCDTLGWFEGDITVEGIGSRNDIILEATGNSEVFLNCCSKNIWLKNISLRLKKGLLSALVVHHGKIQMNDCIIDCNNADIGILLLGGSEAFLENCIICNSNEDGVQMRSLSSLSMTSCKISHCKRHGIQIDAEDSNSSTIYTEITIVNSSISDNDGHGIFLNNVPISDLSLQKPSGDFSILKFFPWLKSRLEDSEISNNKQCDVGISSLCKLQSDQSPASNNDSPFTCHAPDDLNCSALSDLLNEISFTDLNVSKYDME